MKVSRVVNGVLSLGLVAAVAGISWYLPAVNLSVGQSAQSIVQKVKAKNLSVDCPGAFYKFGGKSGVSVNKLEQIGETQVGYSADLSQGSTLAISPVAGASGAGASANSGKPPVQKITSSTLVTASQTNTGAYNFKVIDPAQQAKQSATLLNANQVQLLDDSAIKGLVATQCVPAKSTQWIISAEAITGRDGALILVNSSNIDSTVSLEIYTDAGLVTKGGLNGISVAKHSAVAIAIATLAPKAPTSAIKISANGAAVSAWVQQKTVRGIFAAGADLIPAAISANKKLVIPGMTLRKTSEIIALSRSNEDYFDVEPTIDIFVPGSKPAAVTVQVLGSDQQSFGTVINQTISPQRVARLSVEGLGDGDYTLFIESDQPVQAVARFSTADRKKKPNTDFAYLPAVTATKEIRAITAPSTGVTTLVVANPSRTEAQVEVLNQSTQKIQTFTLGTFASKVLKLKAGNTYQLTSDQATSSTAIVSSGLGISSIALEPYANTGREISVAVR